MYGHVITKFSGMGRLYSYGATSTRALRACEELRYKDTQFNDPLFLNLRWLNWIFLGGYLPSLSINYVAMSKDIEKRLPQLYYIKMKISYDLGFIAIGIAMAT